MWGGYVRAQRGEVVGSVERQAGVAHAVEMRAALDRASVLLFAGRAEHRTPCNIAQNAPDSSPPIPRM